MELAFEIGLVFGTLLGVVLGLAGSYALSRNIKISPAKYERSSKQSSPGKRHDLHSTLSDVHAKYIEQAGLSTPNRGAWRPADSDKSGVARWHTMTSTDMAVHLSSPHPFDRIPHPHGLVSHGTDQVPLFEQKLCAGKFDRTALQSGSSHLSDKSPRIMVWRQSTLGPARQAGDLEGVHVAGDDQMAHDDVPESTFAIAQDLTPSMEEPGLPALKVSPAIAASSTSTEEWLQALLQADIAVLLKLEVAIKRPTHGLLKRMLRLMEVDHEDMIVHGKARRVLSLQSGVEYHIGLKILNSPHLDSGTECAAEWLSISMPGSLPLRFQVAREVGADFWTGGCVWFPTNVWDAQMPHGADRHTSGVMALTLELGLCQTTTRSQESRSVHGSIMYTRWSSNGTSREQAQQRRNDCGGTEASEHLPKLLAAWSIQGDPYNSATDVLLCQATPHEGSSTGEL